MGFSSVCVREIASVDIVKMMQECVAVKQGKGEPALLLFGNGTALVRTPRTAFRDVLLRRRQVRRWTKRVPSEIATRGVAPYDGKYVAADVPVLCVHD